MNTCKNFITYLFIISLLGCFDVPPPPPPPIVGTWNVINRKITVRSTGSSTNIRAYEGAYSGYDDKVFLNSVGNSSDNMKMDLVQENDWTVRGEGRLETKGSCYAHCIIELTR